MHIIILVMTRSKGSVEQKKYSELEGSDSVTSTPTPTLPPFCFQCAVADNLKYEPTW